MSKLVKGNRELLFLLVIAFLSGGVLLSTVVVEPPLQDCMLQSGRHSDTNLNGLRLAVGEDYDYKYLTLVEFDLSKIDVPNDFESVHLRVHTLDSYAFVSEGVIGVYKCEGDWSEYTVTYETAPSYGVKLGEFRITNSGAYEGVWVTIPLDVGFVESWLASGNTKLSLFLVGEKASGSCTDIHFHSKETEALCAPQLVFETVEKYGELHATILVDGVEVEGTVTIDGESYPAGEKILLPVGEYEVSCEMYGETQKDLYTVSDSRVTQATFHFAEPKTGILEVHTYDTEDEEVNIEIEIEPQAPANTIDTLSPVHRELEIGEYKVTAHYDGGTQTETATITEDQTTLIEFTEQENPVQGVIKFLKYLWNDFIAWLRRYL